MVTAEFELLRRLASYLDTDDASVPLAPGDDAAIVRVGGTPVALAVDAVVDGVHFDRSLSTAADVGWKVVAQNVSDLAAIGTTTTAGVVALHLPTGMDTWVDGLYEGMVEAARHWGLALVGGDVVASQTLAVSLSVIGPGPDRPLRRDAARPGDRVLLLGEIGLAAAGLALWWADEHDLLETHPRLLATHRRPPALPEAGVAAAAAGAHAAIDVSDGLGRDAGNIAAASGVRVVIDEEALPLDPGVEAAQERLGRDLLAVGGGDDLALLVSVPPADVERVRSAVAAVGTPVSVIGRIEEGTGATLARRDGSELDISTRGYEHDR